MKLLLTIAALLVANTCNAQVSYETEKDIEFANVDGVSLKLDAYLRPSETPMPCIIYVHGADLRVAINHRYRGPFLSR